MKERKNKFDLYFVKCHLPHSDWDERLHMGYHHIRSLHFLHLTGTIHPLYNTKCI